MFLSFDNPQGLETLTTSHWRMWPLTDTKVGFRQSPGSTGIDAKCITILNSPLFCTKLQSSERWQKWENPDTEGMWEVWVGLVRLNPIIGSWSQLPAYASWEAVLMTQVTEVSIWGLVSQVWPGSATALSGTWGVDKWVDSGPLSLK